MVWTAKISSKGQLTIPKPVREALGLEPGTRVLLVLRGEKVEMEPISEDIAQWHGSLQETAETYSEVRDHVRQAIAQEVIRETKGD